MNSPLSNKMNSPATDKSRTFSEIISFFKTLAFFIVLALIIRGSLIEPFKIPSGSMIPALQIGDRILVSKLSYGIRLPFYTPFVYQYGAPARGDIVVFTRPDELSSTEDESSINLIKRVVALENETVEVRDAKVYINGKLFEEPYARWTNGGPPEGNFGPATVPAGRIFMMGDNRDHSRDSRFWEDPFLETWRVKGRALFVYWNFNSLNRMFTPIR
jgi:signal peptidase I